MAELLSVKGARKSFGALKAVDGVSFSVSEGEIFGIAGPNGSGKTTLFGIITSIPFAADGGEIRFRGRPIERARPHEICRMGLARTFQRETAFDSLTAFDNVLLAAAFGRSAEGGAGRSAETGVADDAAATAALDFIGLPGDLRHRPAAELSVFDRKQLMLASALVTGPKALLLDEPASGLTKPEIEQTIGIIRRVNQAGVTVVLIEHVLPLLLALSERLLILNQGRVLAGGRPDEVMADPRVVEAYLGAGGADHAAAS